MTKPFKSPRVSSHMSVPVPKLMVKAVTSPVRVNSVRGFSGVSDAPVVHAVAGYGDVAFDFVEGVDDADGDGGFVPHFWGFLSFFSKSKSRKKYYKGRERKNNLTRFSRRQISIFCNFSIILG